MLYHKGASFTNLVKHLVIVEALNLVLPRSNGSYVKRMGEELTEIDGSRASRPSIPHQMCYLQVRLCHMLTVKEDVLPPTWYILCWLHNLSRLEILSRNKQWFLSRTLQRHGTLDLA